MSSTNFYGIFKIINEVVVVQLGPFKRMEMLLKELKLGKFY